MKINKIKVILLTVAVGLVVYLVGERLYARTQKIDAALHHDITETLIQLKAVDAHWNEDVLKSRLRLNQDYDPLVTAKTAQARLETQLLEALSAVAESESRVLPHVKTYQKAIRAKSDLAEEFKGENAIFRNSAVFIPSSLSGLSELIKSAKAQPRAPVALLTDLEHRIQALAIGFLQYTTQIQDHIVTLNEQAVNDLKTFSQTEALPVDLSTHLMITLNHIDKVLSKKSVLDDLLTTIISMPTGQRLDQAQTAYTQLYEQQLATSDTYQTLFIAYLALITIMAIYVILRLLNKRRIHLLTTMNEALEKRVELATELEKAHEELKRSQMQLVQSEKMSALGQMVAGVAHEINTPLAYSRSNVALVQEQLESIATLIEAAAQQNHHLPPSHASDDQEASHDQPTTVFELAKSLREEEMVEEMTELLQASVSGLDQISEMVLNLKDFSRLDRKRVDQVNLNDGLDSALMIAKNTLKHKVEIVKAYGELPPVACAPSQINQVFLNLLVNAAQAMPEQGVITLTTRARGNQVEIIIEDDGPGIPEDVLPHIFEPFYTTKDVGEGTGLGLAISYQIIEQHGGTLAAQSRVGHGARFTISLPAAANLSAGSTQELVISNQ